MNIRILPALSLLLASSLMAADPPEPKFRAVTIDDKIQIGYGVAVADVDGDKLPDILLADKKQFVWYRNPGTEKSVEAGAWQKFVIAENLTKADNVCLAAQDIDGDGKCEVAVGAEWNPGDTVNSGAVFYMIPPADRTQRWTPVKLHAEPTTHRMRWIKINSGNSGIRDSGNATSKDGAASAKKNPEIPKSRNPEISSWGLVVLPLHGRGNKNGEGAGVKVLLYHPPAQLNDPKGEWKTELIDDSMHMTHNFEVLGKRWTNGLFLGGKEGLIRASPAVDPSGSATGGWRREVLVSAEAAVQSPGVGEVRTAEISNDHLVVATIEPMHGNQLVVYFAGDSARTKRLVLTDRLSEGHALGFGDLGLSPARIVVGWRGKPGVAESTIGVAVWTPRDPKGEKWRETIIDPDGMACEDLQLADINGDGKLDIIASGRATKNVKVYFNETAR